MTFDMFAQQVGLLGISKNFSKKHSKFFFFFFELSKVFLKILPDAFFFFVLKTLLSVFRSRKNYKKHRQIGPKSNYFINH